MSITANLSNEVLFIGALYKQPDLYLDYGEFIRSKYDFSEDVTKFFFDIAEIIYQTRTQNFNAVNFATFIAENEDRTDLYKKYGGWTTIEKWMSLADPNDAETYFNVLKKYSLLREYERNGYNIQKIVKHPKFEFLKAEDIYRMIRGKVDRINTVIITQDKGVILNDNMVSTINTCLEVPDRGIKIPYPKMDELFRGLKLGSMMCVGMLSNAGKSRYLFKLLAYITLVKKEKTLVLLNEMTTDAMRFCLITTVINNPEFQKLHGYNITKAEREITLGIYKDKNGNVLTRNCDKDGNFTETFQEFLDRVNVESEEYRNIIKVAEWVEDKTNALIHAKDISSSYDDKTLEYEIKKAVVTQNIKYVFYDTLKQDNDAMGEWAALKATTTKLSELAKQNKIFIYGSIQLVDEANHINAENLTSSQIANAKQLKHVLDTLILFKEIDYRRLNNYKYYSYVPEFGEAVEHTLDTGKRYYIAVVDKNRFGGKSRLLFRVDLDLNIWIELGEVIIK